ncbi:hypothetical protein AALO_G00301070 [Alosa alosa]|uniref:G-protein coupled receptors family 1 profile domain-containing protein n=1 Tax=Alosa alosa TaxID=278164 RepID=A0AAV6FLH3_9TELE|nr:hypothetical protein AALO_G00301070 [Alosa alosa]
MVYNLNFSSGTPAKTNATTWDYGYNIRHSIFLITGMCVGLPLVGWALAVLRRHKHNRGRGSALVIALLLTDLLEMVLSPAMVAYLLAPGVTRSGSIFLLFFGVKYCGLHLHQMVALEGIMARTYLPVTSLRFWRPLSILLCLLEGVFLLLFVFVHPFAQTAAVTLTWLLLAVILLGVTCKLTFTPTPTPPDSSETVQDKDRTVLVVATLSFLALYGPFLAFQLTQVSIPPASFKRHANGIMAAMTVIYPAVYLRVLTDPLLCVLVVRELPLDRQQ